VSALTGSSGERQENVCVCVRVCVHVKGMLYESLCLVLEGTSRCLPSQALLVRGKKKMCVCTHVKGDVVWVSMLLVLEGTRSCLPSQILQKGKGAKAVKKR